MDGNHLNEEEATEQMRSIQEPVVQSETEGLTARSAEETMNEEGRGEPQIWEHLNTSRGGFIDGGTMAADELIDPTQTLLSMDYVEAPQHIESAFETSSWMDFDFLGNLPPLTFDSSDPDESQQGSSRPIAAESGCLESNASTLLASNMAYTTWKCLSQDILVLIDRILAYCDTKVL